MALLISFFTLIMGLIIARLSSNLIKRIIRETNSQNFIKMKSPLDEFLPNLTRITIYILTLILILNQQEINIGRSLFIFSIVIFILILLSFKDTIPNLICGIYIKLFNKIKLDSNLKIDGLEGIVKRISIFEVTILTKKKELLSIPNIDLIRKR